MFSGVNSEEGTYRCPVQEGDKLYIVRTGKENFRCAYNENQIIANTVSRFCRWNLASFEWRTTESPCVSMAFAVYNLNPTEKTFQKGGCGGFYNLNSEVHTSPAYTLCEKSDWEPPVWFQHMEPWSTESWICALKSCLCVFSLRNNANHTLPPFFILQGLFTGQNSTLVLMF